MTARAAGPFGLLIALLLAGCSAVAPSSITDGAAAVGQRIFDSGIGANGQLIPRSSGVGMSMMGGAGCAACHGADGRGERSMMFDAPNITYANLTNPAGMIESDGSRGKVYTDALIRRAVTGGIGADGERLSTRMPSWQLSDADWQGLLAYLKALH